MRIVMPVFDFYYKDSQEFEFGDGTYSLRRFVARDEIPSDIGGLSKLDLSYMELESWALVAENPDIGKYRQEVNILLLAFKIYKLARLFIKYRLCKEDPRHCKRLNETVTYVTPEDGKELITVDDLEIVDKGFRNLLKMDAISNRTHNALYFLYRGCFSTHWMDSFIFWICTLESLFSRERRGGAAKTI